MPVTKDNAAPYAPASAILDVVKRYRDRGLPTPVDAEVLARAGVSNSLIPRTLQALQTLDLIDDKGSPTQTFEGLRKAPETEYMQQQAEWLKSAYADVLAFVDPAEDDETKIRDAFRNYNPVGQQPRMVSLFSGLFAAAGIAPEKQKATAAKKPRATPSTLPKRTATRASDRTPRSDHSGLPDPIAGVLSGLPAKGDGWTKDQRDKFMAMFTAVADFCYPIREPSDEAGKVNDGHPEDTVAR